MSSLNVKYIGNVFDLVKQSYISYSCKKKDRIAELMLHLEREAHSKSGKTFHLNAKTQSIDVPHTRDRLCEPKKRLMPANEICQRKQQKHGNELFIQALTSSLSSRNMLPDSIVQNAGLPVTHIHQGLIIDSNTMSGKNSLAAFVVLILTGLTIVSYVIG